MNKNAFTDKGYLYLTAKTGRQINWKKSKLITVVLFTKWSQKPVFLKHIFYKYRKMALHVTSPAQFKTKSTKSLQNIRAGSRNGSNKCF
jgi:hypothetical protein